MDAATGNERRPTVARRYARTCSRCDEDERRRWLPGRSAKRTSWFKGGGRWNRETWQPGTMSPSLISPSHAVCYALMSRKTTELYVKVFQRVQQLVPQFAPTCAMADFEEASVAGFFIDNRLFQITVQTFSIIIATFPFANTYLCCWRCLLVNNIWLYDCALTGALSCFIKRRRTVADIQHDAMMTTKM